MHTGDRSADAIDAGGMLPGYTGIIVRDGYTPATSTSPLRCTPGAGRSMRNRGLCGTAPPGVGGWLAVAGLAQMPGAGSSA